MSNQNFNDEVIVPDNTNVNPDDDIFVAFSRIQEFDNAIEKAKRELDAMVALRKKDIDFLEGVASVTQKEISLPEYPKMAVKLVKGRATYTPVEDLIAALAAGTRFYDLLFVKKVVFDSAMALTLRENREFIETVGKDAFEKKEPSIRYEFKRVK